jgi:5-methylcytosine-specific restriction endonuclease McrA
VHHIRGRIKYPELAFSYENLLTLCAGCHNGYFTKLEDAGKEDQAIEEGEEIKASFK